MIRDTDTWETKPCGCRLQLSIWEHEDTDKPPLKMWVIRTECPEHEAHSAVIQAAIAKWNAGESLDMDDETALKDVRYVDIPTEDIP